MRVGLAPERKKVEMVHAQRSKQKADKEVAITIDQERDENFAYIAGYTALGFSYGTSWEELKWT